MVEVSELQKATNQLAQRLLKSGPKESRTIEYMLLGPRSRDIHNQKGFSKQHKCRLHVEKDEWDLAIRKSQFYLTLSFFYNMSDSIRQTRFVNPIVLQHAHVFQDFPVLRHMQSCQVQPVFPKHSWYVDMCPRTHPKSPPAFPLT